MRQVLRKVLGALIKNVVDFKINIPRRLAVRAQQQLDLIANALRIAQEINLQRVPGPVKPRADPNVQREAFRAFMISRQLRATEWAKQAGIPASVIYSYLTGRAGGLAGDAAEKLAKAARVRVEDMFAGPR